MAKRDYVKEIDAPSIVNKFFGKERKVRSFEVDTDRMYPEVIKEIYTRLKEKDMPEDKGLALYYRSAKKIDDSAWTWALQKKESTPVEKRGMRAEALELARLWFTKEIRLDIGEDKALYLHLTKSDRYKL